MPPPRSSHVMVIAGDPSVDPDVQVPKKAVNGLIAAPPGDASVSAMSTEPSIDPPPSVALERQLAGEPDRPTGNGGGRRQPRRAVGTVHTQRGVCVEQVEDVEIALELISTQLHALADSVVELLQIRLEQRYVGCHQVHRHGGGACQAP